MCRVVVVVVVFVLFLRCLVQQPCVPNESNGSVVTVMIVWVAVFHTVPNSVGCSATFLLRRTHPASSANPEGQDDVQVAAWSGGLCLLGKTVILMDRFRDDVHAPVSCLRVTGWTGG